MNEIVRVYGFRLDRLIFLWLLFLGKLFIYLLFLIRTSRCCGAIHARRNSKKCECMNENQILRMNCYCVYLIQNNIHFIRRESERLSCLYIKMFIN